MGYAGEFLELDYGAVCLARMLSGPGLVLEMNRIGKEPYRILNFCAVFCVVDMSYNNKREFGKTSQINYSSLEG